MENILLNTFLGVTVLMGLLCVCMFIVLLRFWIIPMVVFFVAAFYVGKYTSSLIFKLD